MMDDLGPWTSGDAAGCGKVEGLVVGIPFRNGVDRIQDFVELLAPGLILYSLDILKSSFTIAKMGTMSSW